MIDELLLDDFQYNLPDEKIARFPLTNRDQSKLLVFNNQKIEDHLFYELPKLLPKNSLIIFNNTRVIRARIITQNKNNARIEIFCLEPYPAQPIEEAMQAVNKAQWLCAVGNLKKWKDEDLKIITTNFVLTLQKVNTTNEGVIVEFAWNHSITFSQLLEQLGQIPLPPYLKRNEEKTDENTYQTVYAKVDGSVAAPTAGLHFTESILNKLHQQGHTLAHTTLHVGAGTFMPVKSEKISNHVMHHEEIIVDINLLKAIIAHKNEVVCVGTTSLRTLESIYWISYLMIDKNLQPENGFYYLSQWTAYSLQKEHNIPFKLSCQKLLHFMQEKKYLTIKIKTQILIAPGYRINSVQKLITNFHQPGSTLMLLVACLTGKENWKKIYQHALENNYRFLSYGDSSLLSITPSLQEI